ncbi:carotenoid 1,2-hydratase [Enterovibrio makurazakiensis]|uniref:lipocalin-like domain-containing protein n=1 Tax=Enterovibrio makurazakiensis TaxID=2910232 RepID=UPI003D1C16E0
MRDEDTPQPFILTIIGWSLAIFVSALALFGSILLRSDDPDKLAVDILVAENIKGFTAVTRNANIQFPADYGRHDDFRQEWWYVTANLTDKEGNDYGVQWTLFRSALSPEQGKGWNNKQVYMAHAVVTTKNHTFYAERFARAGIGQAGVESEPFHAWLDNWQWQSETKAPFPAALKAQDDTFSISLTMAQTQPEILQGDNGYSRKHLNKDVGSYYFSVPAITLEGTLTLEGKEISVNGNGWVDREWSTQALSEDQQGWDWFSIQLNDGRALMVVQVRADDGPYRFGSLTLPNGETKILSHTDITMLPLSFSKMPTSRHLPTEWQIDIEKEDISLRTSPLNTNNWLPFAFPYWEGPIFVEGSATGVGFMEATGY